MKKLLSLLFSILLVSSLVFSTVSCNKEESEEEVLDENVAPITLTIETETDDEGNPEKILTEVALSALAKSYVDDNDFAKLDDLLKDHGAAQYLTVNGDKVTLTIPKVDKIAANSVVNLSFVTNLVVDNAVKEIEKGAFVGLSGLETITLPFVGGKVGAVNEAKLFAYIFGTIGTEGLTAVTQNYNIGTESTSSLYVPTSLKKVIVTGAVNVTEEKVKYYINDDNEHVVLGAEETAPEGKPAYEIDVASYKDSAVQPFAFYGITTVEEVVFEGDIDHIPEYTFYGCSAIKVLDFTGSKITKLGNYAYANCTSLRKVTFNALAIGEGAFSGCTSLGKATAIEAGSLDLTNVTTVGKDAFLGCTSLSKEKVVLGAHSEEELKDAFNKDFFKADEE